MSTVQISQNPYSLAENSAIPTLNINQIESTINSSHEAYKTWSKLDLDKRIQALESFKNLLTKNLDQLANLITIEIGCPITQTRGEVNKCIQVCDYYLANVNSYLTPELVYQDETVSKSIHYDPIGPILHISPYNYPLYLALRPIIPALLAGNTVLLKTPSQTPLLGKKIEEIIKSSSITEGVFQVLFVAGSDIEPVIEDDRIKIITLIGSEKAGSQVASIAGKNLKKTLLELGGSDPMIVNKDANIEEVSKAIMASRIRNAGQSCNAIKRVIVHSSVHDQLVDILKTNIEKLTPGDPLLETTDIGPMANSQGLHTALNQIEEALSQGAKLIIGGKEVAELGHFLEPTILTDVTSKMLVFKEEVFAPVIPLISSPFATKLQPHFSQFFKRSF